MNPGLESNKPLVSILTVCYNSASTIDSTLKSVASQTYASIEHIIIDGLSRDNTLDIIRRYPHVRKVISEKDDGIYDAMNKGISMATGEIIGILNSDDFYTDEHVIGNVVKTMQSQNSDALYADLVYVSSTNLNKWIRKWTAGPYRVKKFLYGWMPPHPTFFVRREAYKKFGSFNTKLRSAADYELMLRFLFKHKLHVAYLPHIIVKMRAGGNSNASLKNRIKAHKEDREAWRLNQLSPYFFTIPLKPIRKLAQYLTRFSF